MVYHYTCLGLTLSLFLCNASPQTPHLPRDETSFPTIHLEEMSNNISITQSISGTGAIRIAGASQTTHRVFALDVCSGRLGSEILNTAVWIHKGQFDGLRKMLKLITKPVSSLRIPHIHS